MLPRQTAERLAGRAEGLMLLLTAAYLGWLLGSDNFWQMLNPRFAWLAGATTAGLLCCGAVLLWRPAAGNLFRSGSLALFCILLAVTLWGPQGMALPDDVQESPFAVKQPEPLEPLVLDGVRYTRISTAELLQMAETAPQKAQEGRWALRGMVGRTPQLDAAGSFALLRPFVWCCLADGVAVGFQVPYEETASLQEGQWVQVLGRLAPAETAAAEDLSLGGFFVALDDRHVLLPAENLDSPVQAIEPPQMPYVFTVRESAPFTW